MWRNLWPDKSNILKPKRRSTEEKQMKIKMTIRKNTYYINDNSDQLASDPMYGIDEDAEKMVKKMTHAYNLHDELVEALQRVCKLSSNPLTQEIVSMHEQTHGAKLIRVLDAIFLDTREILIKLKGE